jgi:hypothetical protein
MPAAISNLRAGLAAALSSMNGMRVYETLPDAPVPPCAVIQMKTVSYDSVFARGADEFQFSIQVVTGRADDRTAVARLEGFIAGSGAGSIKTALEADPTLGGRCQTLRVVQAGNITTITNDSQSMLIVEFTVELYA